MLKNVKARLSHKVKSQSSRNITTHSMIINESAHLTNARKDILNMYGQVDGNLGVLKMNREHRYNSLTPNMIENISRGVETMNIDHIITTIYLSTDKSQHFSGGTDFRTIAFMKKENNYEAIKQYLEQIYRLQTQIAKLNKPLIAVASGRCYNSGAALLAATAHPITTLKAKIAFNEVTFGFVPHSGATYYLSRLPGEFGTFMALTGLPINGADACNIELAHGIVYNPQYYAEEVGEFVKAIEFTRAPEPEQIKLSDPTEWEKYLFERAAKKDQQRTEDWSRLGTEKLDSSVREDFIEAKDRVPSLVAQANFNYMQKLKQDAQRNEQDTGYFEFGQNDARRDQPFRYNNYFQETLGYLKTHLGNQYPASASKAVQHRQLIDRCFMSNSVEQIMENLKKETHPFAQQCLEAMENNSMLSMKLALQMLRRASNLDYKKAMEMEIVVGLNKIQDDDFDKGVSQVLLNPKERDAKFQKKINDGDLDKYFEESKWSKQVNVGVVENALLPTRHYYQRFTDQVRLWLNEESTTQCKIREDFDKEAKEALRQQGIDVRDLALTPQIARDHLRAKLAQERVEQIFNERTDQLMTDTKLRENYFKQIREKLQQLESNQTYFYNQVNKHVASVFEDAYLERLDKIYKKSQQAHSLEKRKMFVNFKKFLFKSRILTYDNLEEEKLMKQVQAYPFQQIHLTERWNETFREQDHPFLATSPIYQISKVVGQVSLTPPEMVKSYLTDSKNRDAMKLLTLDKKKLQALQQDILQNPEKYEMILKSNQELEVDHRRQRKTDRDLKEEKERQAEYWFRVINDGACPLDSFPYAREFQSYKSWAEGIESKALDTLVFAVNSLLLDAEKAKTYEGKLSHLKGLVSANKKQQKIQSKMGDKSRPTTEVKVMLQNVIKADPDFGHLFNFDTKNASINNFRKECEAELLKIIEVALLDKFGYSDNKQRQILEQRLALLTNPKNVEHQQLNLIDSYLNKSNGEAVIKEAIDVVRPFFKHTMNAKFEQQAQKVLEEFKFSETQPDLTLHYFFNLMYPKALETGPLARYLDFSLSKYAYETATAALPFFSARHKQRDLLEVLGRQIKTRNINQSMEHTSQEISKLKTFEQNSTNMYEQFNQATLEEKENHINFSPMEIDELEAMENRLLDIYDYLHYNKYELDNNLTRVDWLNMYSKAILEQNFPIDTENAQQLAEYAKFLKDLEISFSKARSQDVAQFMAHVDAKNLSQETIYNQVIQERNEMVRKSNQVNHVNRTKIITGAIEDFNNLQSQIATNKQLKERINRLLVKFPNKKEIQSFLEQDKYIDLEAVYQSLQNEDTKFLTNPKQVIDIKRFIQDNRKSVKLDFTVDAVSLVTAKMNIIDDTILSEDVKRNLIGVIDHIQETTQTLSNKDRKQIHIKDYLQKFNFQSAEALSLYSSDLLKNKIINVLGQIDEETPEVIDWQVAQFRTHPADHELGVPLVRFGKTDEQQDDFDDIIEEIPLPEDIKIQSDEKIVGAEDVDESLSEFHNPPTHNFVQTLNPVTGSVENDEHRKFIYKQVLRQARDLTSLNDSMITTKNQYENKLLMLMANPEYTDDQAKALISEYTQIRLKSCMLNPEFAVRIKGDDNGHVYLKVLKEQVVEELGLTKPPEASNLAFEDIFDPKNDQFFDPESQYNMQSINNANALGYNNIDKRQQAKSATENFEAAHESVFDKLLADYFLSKRGEYKESNNLMKELSEIFGTKKYDTPQQELDYKLLQQNIGKQDAPTIEPESFRTLIELDNATQRAVQDSKNGLSQSLRKLSINQTTSDDYFKTQVPEYFEIFDARKPPKQYVDDKLRQIIKEMFEVRAELERNMTRGELISFDKVLSRYLQHERLMPKLKAAVESDYAMLHQGKTIVQAEQENLKNSEMQIMKTENKQASYNKRVVNEDAQYKMLAFNAMQDKQNEKLSETNTDLEAAFSYDSFAQFYKDELLQDQFKRPREVDANQFKRKKPWELSTEPFKNKRKREEEFFKEHTTYLENKKENQERIQMFYILEQFLEAARSKPDSTSRAQEEIKQYFSDPDNTFFFDKNKIQ